jgi:hypothetical protein
MATCISSDWGFGPQVDQACRQFDFTLLFEATFLSTVPSAILLACLSVRLWKVAGVSTKVHGGNLLLCKVVCDFAVEGPPGSTNYSHTDQHWLSNCLARRFTRTSRYYAFSTTACVSCRRCFRIR